MGSGDDQSEDGELRQSPSESRHKAEVLDFRLVLYVINQFSCKYRDYLPVCRKKMVKLLIL